MKKITATFAAFCTAVSSLLPVFAAEKNVITVHGEKVKNINNAVVINDCTMVPIRDIAEALGLGIIWFQDTKTMVLWNDEFEFRAQIDNINAQINGRETTLTQAPRLEDGYTYLPLRNVSEVVNAEVVWDSKSGNTDIYPNKKAKGSFEYTPGEKVFFSQRDAEWSFDNNGNGYCWVCAYAMAITEAKEELVTPDMVAEVNKESGSGAFMQHGKIAEKFGITFTPALSENSEYFEKYEGWKGATYINAEDDEQATAALKEALDKNPQGVMVRYTVYPHTLYAVGYSDEGILFNEPAYENGEGVTFDKTCLKKYKLHELDFIQAIEK